MTFVRNCRPQSIAARRPQPAARILFSLAVLVALLGAPPASAQQAATVRRDGEPLLGAPGGTQIGRLAAGVPLVRQAASAGAVQVTVDGWIARAAVAAVNRDGHNLQTTREENVRAVPNGRLLARLVKGALLDSVDARAGWLHVRRTGWVAARGLGGGAPAAAGAAPPADSAAAAAADSGNDAVLLREAPVYRNTGGAPAGTLEAGVPVRVTARAGDWVRVQTSAWVKASDLKASAGQSVSGVTAAELRSAPEEWKGKTLRWTIQFLALQTADELRPDFTPGQRYILARGPAPEYAFVYVTVPPELVDRVARLQPLDSVTVVARVKSGRSTYLANPILELVSLAP